MLSPSEAVDVYIQRALAPAAPETDDEMVEALLADGIDSETAECLIAFVPISPDGKTIACIGRNESKRELLILPFAGGQPIRQLEFLGRRLGYNGPTMARR